MRVPNPKEIEERLHRMERVLFIDPVDSTGLPDQGGHSGEFLSTDGSNPSWTSIPALGIPGIDDVLAEAQAITADRVINAAGFNLTHTADTHTFNSVGDLVASFQNASFQLYGYDDTDNGSRASIEAGASPTNVVLTIGTDFNDGTKEALIDFFSDATTSTITHTADTHTFNAGGEQNGFISLGQSFIRGFDPTDNGNESSVQVSTNNAEASFNLNANFNDGVTEAQIEALADSTSSSITYTADQHIFNLQNFANNAAAVGGGLPVGALYYTDTAGEGIVKIVI